MPGANLAPVDTPKIVKIVVAELQPPVVAQHVIAAMDDCGRRTMFRRVRGRQGETARFGPRLNDQALGFSEPILEPACDPARSSVSMLLGQERRSPYFDLEDYRSWPATRF
jgi:hypothetical protein